MRWCLIATLWLGLTILMACGGGESPVGLFGRVISKSTRQPIPNVVVVVRQNETGTEVARTTTNNDGAFAFPNLSPGSYTLVVTAEGFLEAQVVVILTAETPRKTIVVTLFPEQEGPPTDVPITD